MDQIIHSAQQKKCTKCQRLRPIDEFPRNLRMADGRHYWCKECVRAYTRSDRGRAAVRRAVTKKQEEGYYRFGRGAISILRQGAQKRGIPFNLTPNDLESWWRKTPDVCEYCGSSVHEFRLLRDLVLSYSGEDREITNFKRVFATSKQAKIDWMTIDRLDNALGYELGNLEKACWFCNYLKGPFLTYDDIKVIGARVITRLREKVILAGGEPF